MIYNILLLKIITDDYNINLLVEIPSNSIDVVIDIIAKAFEYNSELKSFEQTYLILIAEQ